MHRDIQGWSAQIRLAEMSERKKKVEQNGAALFPLPFTGLKVHGCVPFWVNRVFYLNSIVSDLDLVDGLVRVGFREGSLPPRLGLCNHHLLHVLIDTMCRFEHIVTIIVLPNTSGK